MALPLTGPYFAINDLRADVAWLRQQTRRRFANKANRSKVEELEAAVDHLNLLIATLFRILVVEKLVDVGELRTLLDRVDAEDGQLDGAYRGLDPVSGQELAAAGNPFAGLDY
jgi:hypothetical protein